MFLSKDLDDLFNRFIGQASTPGALDGKTKELVALACSVMADCVPCIEVHVKKAVELGATEDELSETLAITMMVGAGSKRAKYSKLLDELRRTDRS